MADETTTPAVDDDLVADLGHATTDARRHDTTGVGVGRALVDHPAMRRYVAAQVAERDAEITRLRASLDTAVGSANDWLAAYERMLAERDSARAEVERLRAEAEQHVAVRERGAAAQRHLLAEHQKLLAEHTRLREAVGAWAGHLSDSAQHYCPNCGPATDERVAELRAVLGEVDSDV